MPWQDDEYVPCWKIEYPDVWNLNQTVALFISDAFTAWLEGGVNGYPANFGGLNPFHGRSQEEGDKAYEEWKLLLVRMRDDFKAYYNDDCQDHPIDWWFPGDVWRAVRASLRRFAVTPEEAAVVRLAEMMSDNHEHGRYDCSLCRVVAALRAVRVQFDIEEDLVTFQQKAHHVTAETEEKS